MTANQKETSLPPSAGEIRVGQTGGSEVFSSAMNDPVYSIRDWDRHFENNRSRSVENLRWVCVPNRHDGEGYSLLMEQDDAAELFAAWVLILQVASKCRERGRLVRDDGTPLTAKSLASKTRSDKAWFVKAFNFFTTKVKWMDCHPPVTQVTADCHPPVTQVTKKEGREGNEGEWSARAREEALPVLDSETLARQGRSLESISSRLDLPAANFLAHGATLGLSEAKVRQWADSRVANGWSTGKGKPLTPVTWPADMNSFAAASNEISKKHNGKNHANPSRNDGTANAGRAAAFADIGKLRPGV